MLSAKLQLLWPVGPLNPPVHKACRVGCSAGALAEVHDTFIHARQTARAWLQTIHLFIHSLIRVYAPGLLEPESKRVKEALRPPLHA